jgi:phospholipase C
MTDPIEHVILLALENRSFDQMLGCMNEVFHDLEGASSANINQHGGTIYRQEPTTERQTTQDPRHEAEHVARQLAAGNGGFVEDFVAAYGDSTPAERQAIMGYYPRDFLPALHRLARNYTVCDHWFSSVPGPTWPNRFFLLTGTSSGLVSMPGDDTNDFKWPDWFAQDQDTIFDRLTERGIHWKCYFHDIPQSSVLVHQRRLHNAARYFYINEFFRDAAGRAEDFPQFSFIEPDYMGFDENDDHPPHDVMKAERLIARVYNAVRANPQLWRTTLLIVLFDEHGGFYDHVPPPAAVPPDALSTATAFKSLGVRVPAVLVSPWVRRGVVKTPFDHTSLLKYLIDKWGLGPLGDRTAAADSIGVAVTTQARADEDCVSRIELTEQELTPPDPELEEQAATFESKHHRALQQMGKFLKASFFEDTWFVYAWLARALMLVKGLLEIPLEWIESRHGNLKVSITEPDRIARKTVTVREDFAQYLMRKKRRAPQAIGWHLSRTDLSETDRAQAVRTLALITGRRFHQEEDRHEAVDKWLRKYRYRR